MSNGFNSLLGPVLQTGTGGDGAAGGAILLVVLLFVLLFIGLWIYGCVWIYRDAKRRGANELIWTVAMVAGGFTFGLIAVGAVALAWVLARPPVDGDGGTTGSGTSSGGANNSSNADGGSSDAASSWDVDNDNSKNSGDTSSSADSDWDNADDNSSNSEYDVWDDE